MMMNRTNPLVPVACCAAIAALAPLPAAHAVPLLPGETMTLTGTTAIQTPWLVPSSVSLITNVEFEILDNSNAVVFEGIMDSYFAVSDELGTVRVDYRIRSTSGVGGRRITGVTLQGFEGFQTNVDFITDAQGLDGPSLAERSAGGDKVSFGFAPPALQAGIDSKFFYVHTDAPASDLGGAAIIFLDTGEQVTITGIRRPTRSVCPGDTNGDGTVNFTDLNTVLSEFGEDCP